jgi:hypothetical protein
MSSLCEFDTVFIASMDLLLTLLLATNSGDSCHPMLPYLAQGANSAIEDGAVLGLLLGHLSDYASLAATPLPERHSSRLVVIVFLVYCPEACSHYALAERVFPHARRSRTARSGRGVRIPTRCTTDQCPIPESMDLPGGPAMALWVRCFCCGESSSRR